MPWKFFVFRTLTISLDFSYIQFSQIAARVVRKSLKPGPKAEADKRGDGMIKMKKWIGGKPEGELKCDTISLMIFT